MKTKRQELLRDALTLCGMIAVVIGLYLAWPPLAWIAGGALLLAGGIGWQLVADRERSGPPRV